jgi:hypothetical protein
MVGAGLAVAGPAKVAAPPAQVIAELERILGEVAARIAEHGTESERSSLREVADASRWTAPGAAAALVDWEGSETARLRAFGVLHGVVVSVLGPDDQAWLLARLSGTGAGELGRRVA